MRHSFRFVHRTLRQYLAGQGSFGEFREFALTTDRRLYDAAVYACVDVPTIRPTRNLSQKELSL